MGRFKQCVHTAAALLTAFGGGAATAQVTVLSETWEGSAIGEINPVGGAMSLGNNFAGDNVWTVISPTQDAGSGPHMQHEIIEFNGSKWLGWQEDGTENAIDTQLFYQAPVASSFELGDAASVTFSFNIVPKVISTGGRRSATFYIGSSVNDCYRFQINLRASASELLEVEPIVGGVSSDAGVFGDPSNFDDIVVDQVYTFVGTITPTASETTVTMEFRQGANVIESGSIAFSSGDMLPLTTQVDFFVLRARQRTFQLWDNLLLQYTAVDEDDDDNGGGDEIPSVPIGAPAAAPLALVGLAALVGAAGAITIRRRQA